MMRVLVCGGRGFGLNVIFKSTSYASKLKERIFMYSTLNSLLRQHEVERKDVTIIEGMAKGADTVAYNYSGFHGCKSERYPADWDKFGKGAGPIRNAQMLKEGKPDIVVAFAGGKGTANMVGLANKAGIKVLDLREVEV